MDVGIVTVGDELLSGDTVNSNASWLGKEVTDRGATVRRVTVVPDEVDEIVTVLQRHRDSYDAVIVTGGLGPTHDDRTMLAVATTFDRPLEENEQALAWLVETRGYDPASLTSDTAALPTGATPLHNEEGVAPGAVIENVYVLPGVPAEMRSMFKRVAEDFTGVTRHIRTVRTDEPESALVPRIDRLRDEFDVRVGSYPGDTVLIRISSEDESEVEAAAAWFRDRVSLVADPAASSEEGVDPEGGQDEAGDQNDGRS